MEPRLIAESPIRIVAISYNHLTKLIHQVHFPFPPGVELVVVDALMDEALSLAKQFEKERRVDVFISSGANGSLLEAHCALPTVRIRYSGFDIMRALGQCDDGDTPIGIITYLPNPLLHSIQSVLKRPVLLQHFTTEEELKETLNTLQRAGVQQIVGGSMALEQARRRGLKGFFIHSADSVTTALQQAVLLGTTRRAEMIRAAQLDTILNSTREGIIATDNAGLIQVYNPSAEQIVGVPAAQALGRHATEVIPGTRIHRVLDTEEAEIGRLQSVHGTAIVTNRVPMHDSSGTLVGCVVTFLEAQAISKAEATIRKGVNAKQFQARTTFDDIVHQSFNMRQLINKAEHYARGSATILVTGETGTGKELLAQAIHLQSPRCTQAFVAINCAALPHTLLESELFGYEDGAFTGARRKGKQGLFELAHGGTVFLDEIGELPVDLQARLLRVLQEKEILRLGGDHVIPVDVRIIAATNRDLGDMVVQGMFRKDLFYRLNVLRLNVPPLRQRREDIPLLLQSFLKQSQTNLPNPVFDELCTQVSRLGHDWPGNIRELRNFFDRFLAVYEPDMVLDASFVPSLIDPLSSPAPGRKNGDPQAPAGPVYASATADMGRATGRKQYTKVTEHDVRQAMKACANNISAAARLLNADRSTIKRMLNRMGI